MSFDVPTALHRIAGRADHVGHVLLEPDEIAFARTELGARLLVAIDAERCLYKLTPQAREQLAI